MKRIPVDSSNIADVGYDASSMVLELGFKRGDVYQYFDVPDSVYRELMRAASKGTFFNANIRNVYRNARL